MQEIRSRIQPFIGSRSFYKGALAVMLPVTIKQLINSMFNMVDNVMVGSLDLQGLAMTAVSVANKPFNIFSGIIFGLMGAGGLLISQYFGANDRKTCIGLFWMQMLVSIASSVLMCATLFFAPTLMMRIFVTDERTIALGVKYMQIVCFSYVPAAVSSTCSFSLSSIGRNSESMLVSLGSMAVNAACNYVLIFGKLGFPALGVEGAALGTLLARLFEMAIYLTLMLRRRMYFDFEPLAFVKLRSAVKRAFAMKALPLIGNELLFNFGINLYFWCYARLDEAALPALTIAELCYQISAVIIMGNSSAVSVLIGKELGAGELQRARDNCKKLLTLTLVIGLVCVALCCGLAFVIPLAYSVNDELRALATRIACVMAAFAPFSFVYGFCFFCLRAGGDTRAAMLLDSGYMWLVPVPASVLMALLLPGKLPMIAAVLIVQVLMNAKIVLALRVLKKGKWVRNITLAD